jgi:parallel beta-helix repeat protein
MDGKKLLLFCCLSLVLHPLIAQQDHRKQLQTKLITVEDGDTVFIDEGRYNIDATISMEGKKNVTIAGKGPGKTILSFKGQKSGAEGLRISNCTDITVMSLSVEDAKGDCIKAMNVKGISFRDVHAKWTGKLSKKNGSYAIYPVLCEKVLIENCEARGASDAGIYVGQSQNIIVRNNKAYENVAGIEIENSLYADVYQNETYANTGGILVFDLPDLQLKRGGYCRVYNNIVKENNTKNFAPKGNIVGKVPLGTGILLLASNQVEVFNNQVINNRTVGTGVISYFITENTIKDSSYYPYPTAVSIHNNEYSREKKRATMKGRMGKLYRLKLKFGKDVPDIIYDGIKDEKIILADGKYPDAKKVCISNNKGATYANLDAANGFKNISRDIKEVDCTLPAIAAVASW